MGPKITRPFQLRTTFPVRNELPELDTHPGCGVNILGNRPQLPQNTISIGDVVNQGSGSLPPLWTIMSLVTPTSQKIIKGKH